MLEKDDAHIIGNTEMKTFGLGLLYNFTKPRPGPEEQGQGHKSQGQGQKIYGIEGEAKAKF